PGIEAISFTGFWEPFDKNIVLRIRFYLPTKATISITSQELEDLRQYWMEAKPISWRSAAWNEFSPWPTQDIIDKEAISQNNLGVLIKVEGGTSGKDTLIPAFVYHSNLPSSVGGYTLYLRSNRYLNGVKCFLSKITKNGESKFRNWTLGKKIANT